MRGFDGQAFDRWLTTDPRAEPSDLACVICGEEPEYDYDGGAVWGEVTYARTVLPVCSLACACTCAASVDDPAGRVAATRCVVDTLRSSDDYLAITVLAADGSEVVGTVIASAGGMVTIEHCDKPLAYIMSWTMIADVTQLSE